MGDNPKSGKEAMVILKMLQQFPLFTTRILSQVEKDCMKLSAIKFFEGVKSVLLSLEVKFYRF